MIARTITALPIWAGVGRPPVRLEHGGAGSDRPADVGGGIGVII